MAVGANKNNWVGVLRAGKTYGIVKTKNGTHVRNYKRQIKNGLDVLAATHHAHYGVVPDPTDI